MGDCGGVLRTFIGENSQAPSWLWLILTTALVITSFIKKAANWRSELGSEQAGALPFSTIRFVFKVDPSIICFCSAAVLLKSCSQTTSCSEELGTWVRRTTKCTCKVSSWTAPANHSWLKKPCLPPFSWAEWLQRSLWLSKTPVNWVIRRICGAVMACLFHSSGSVRLSSVFGECSAIFWVLHKWRMWPGVRCVLLACMYM